MEKKTLNLFLWKDWLILFAAGFLVYLLGRSMMNGFRNFISIISPFLIGIAIAYFLSRPAARVEKMIANLKVPFLKKRARVLSVLLVFLILIGVISLVFNYAVPVIVSNIIDFSGEIQRYYNDFIAFITAWDQNELIVDFLNDFDITDIVPDTTDIMQQLGAGALSLLGLIFTVTSSVMNFILSIIIALYLLIYKELVFGLLHRIAIVSFKEKTVASIKSYIHKSNEIFYQFISAQFLDACILGTIATAGLAIGNVQYAVTLGLLLGVCNMIPYFGSIFASVVTVVITLFTGGPQQALMVGIGLLILQQIDANFIGPRITGDALGINPILIIFSIIVGGAYFGIIGMFISVPIAAMLKMFLNDFLEIREKKLAEKSLQKT